MKIIYLNKTPELEKIDQVDGSYSCVSEIDDIFKTLGKPSIKEIRGFTITNDLLFLSSLLYGDHVGDTSRAFYGTFKAHPGLLYILIFLIEYFSFERLLWHRELVKVSNIHPNDFRWNIGSGHYIFKSYRSTKLRKLNKILREEIKKHIKNFFNVDMRVETHSRCAVGSPCGRVLDIKIKNNLGGTSFSITNMNIDFKLLYNMRCLGSYLNNQYVETYGGQG